MSLVSIHERKTVARAEVSVESSVEPMFVNDVSVVDEVEVPQRSCPIDISHKAM